jgi:transmembrane sensor
MYPSPEHLILRRLTGAASAEDQAALDHWLAENPNHQAIYDSYAAIWSESYAAKQIHPISNGLEQLNRKIDKYESEQRIIKFRWPRIAASIVFLMATGISLFFLINRVNQPAALVWEERITSVAQKLTINLPDGSLVKLNSNSSIRFPKSFDSNQREVFCSGEVFFDVKKDSQHPFIVHAGEVTTRVLGTSFNIAESDSSTTVTVATGLVKVSTTADEQIIKPKEQVLYLKANQELSLRIADLNRELAWKDNVLYFSDTPLAQVANTLQSWYGVTISLENERIGNCQLTGQFRNESLEKVLDAISFSTGIKYEWKESKLIWSGNGCDLKSN